MGYWKRIEPFSMTYGRLTLDFGPYTFKKRVVLMLGRNGSGKTTCLKCLASLLPADQGVLHYGMQYVAGRFSLPLNLKVREYLDASLGMAHDTRRICLEKLVGHFDLALLLDKPLKACSDGMRQRVAIAAALLHDDMPILLDEPLRSLDDTYRHRLVEWIMQGRSGFVIATHEPEAFKTLDPEVVHI